MLDVFCGELRERAMVNWGYLRDGAPPERRLPSPQYSDNVVPSLFDPPFRAK